MTTVTIFLPPDWQDCVNHDGECWTEKTVGFTEGERFNGNEWTLNSCPRESTEPVKTLWY